MILIVASKSPRATGVAKAKGVAGRPSGPPYLGALLRGIS